MIEIIKKYSKNSIFVSVFLVIFSIFLMVRPLESINTIIMIYGVLILVDGIFHVISYFKIPKEFILFNFELIQGALQVVFGLFCIMKPEILTGIFQVLIGIWILMSSVVRFQLSLDLKRSGSNNYMILMALSIFTFILSLLMITDPLSSFITLTTLIGIVMFISEIVNIIQYIIILRKMK